MIPELVITIGGIRTLSFCRFSFDRSFSGLSRHSNAASYSASASRDALLHEILCHFRCHKNPRPGQVFFVHPEWPTLSANRSR